MTGYGHPKCYLRGSLDCSQKITSEHYVSRAILAQFDRITLRGIPWAIGGRAEVGINSLVAKVLCQRHNAALSPLDAMAAHAFRNFKEGIAHALKRSLSKKTLYSLSSGDALELWAVKTMAGLFFSKTAAAQGERIFGDYEADLALIEQSLVAGKMNWRAGLYVEASIGLREPGLGLAPLLDEKRRMLCGLRLAFSGTIFDCILDTGGANPAALANHAHYRPAVVDLEGPERTARCILTWHGQGEKRTRTQIKLARGRISDLERASVN